MKLKHNILTGEELKEYTKPKRKSSSYKPTEEEAKLYYQLYYQEKALKNVKYVSKPKMNYTSHGNFLEGLLARYAIAYSFAYVKCDVKGTFRDGKWTKTKATKGAPDVYIGGNGRIALIEVKGKGDKLSDEQTALHESFRNNGVPVFLFEAGKAVEQLRDIHKYLTS